MLSRHAAIVLLSLLLLSTVTAALPIARVEGSTGFPTLGVTNTDSTQPTAFTAGTSYVNVTAGTDAAKTDGSTTGFFAIDFGTFGGSQLVSFFGTQFKLYFSQDGFSQISSGDISYSGPTLFSVPDLTTNPGWHAVAEANGTFYIGQTTGGTEVVTGPLPIKVTTAYKFIKIYDGSSTAIAVGSQSVNVQPGLAITPTSGPAGAVVKVTAGGFPASKTVELTYSYTFFPWNGVSVTHSGNWTTNLSTGTGTFTFSGPMLDTKQAYNPNSGVQTATQITIFARHEASPHTLYASTSYSENSRFLNGVKSFNSAGGVVDATNAPPGPYGNDTSAFGPNLAQPVNANVLGTLNIAGSDWASSSSVTFLVGASQVGSATTDAAGHFNATISVPILPAGAATLKVVNNGVTYQFGITILPTLVLTPSSGPVGTHVIAQAYGFPANGKWFLYWHGYSVGDNTWYQVAHGTTGAQGTFNVTVAFNVPQSNVASHTVVASSTNVTMSSPASPGATEAMATMIVGAAATTSTTSVTTVTTTVSTTVTQSVTHTEPTTVIQSTTQIATVTQPTTIRETVVQATTETTTSVSASDQTYTYAALGGAGIVIVALAALLLRARRP